MQHADEATFADGAQRYPTVVHDCVCGGKRSGFACCAVEHHGAPSDERYDTLVESGQKLWMYAGISHE